MAAMNTANMEGEESDHWNPVKTIALVMVSPKLRTNCDD